MDSGAQRPASSRRRVAAIVALWVTVMGAVSLASGCYGRTCEGEVTFFGKNAGEGRLLGADTWESGPIDGTWLPFPKQRAWVFELRDLGGRLPAVVTPYVSAQADPTREPGGSFAIAAGNLAEISGIASNQVVVRNGTCADYFIRVVVEAAPRGPDAEAPSPIPDAGGDAAAGP